MNEGQDRAADAVLSPDDVTGLEPAEATFLNLLAKKFADASDEFGHSEISERFGIGLRRERIYVPPGKVLVQPKPRLVSKNHHHILSGDACECCFWQGRPPRCTQMCCSEDIFLKKDVLLFAAGAGLAFFGGLLLGKLHNLMAGE